MRVEGALPPPFHYIYYHIQSCSVRSSCTTLPISSLPYMYSVLASVKGGARYECQYADYSSKLVGISQ
jgi:hypothetical protein